MSKNRTIAGIMMMLKKTSEVRSGLSVLSFFFLSGREVMRETKIKQATKNYTRSDTYQEKRRQPTTQTKRMGKNLLTNTVSHVSAGVVIEATTVRHPVNIDLCTRIREVVRFTMSTALSWSTLPIEVAGHTIVITGVGSVKRSQEVRILMSC